MAEFPALPLFTDAYLADTRHLTTEEHGAYLLLLMEAWRRPECSLPDDDKLLARLAGLPIDRWREIKDTIMAFWTRDGRRKTWTQKRQIRERSFVAQKSASQRDKAVKRWKGEKKTDATAMPNACPDDAPTPTPTYKKEEEYAREAEKSPERIDLFPAVLAACGLNGGPLPTYWMPPAAEVHVNRWRSLGLSDAEVIEVVRAEQMNRTDKPRGPKAFDAAMARLAQAKTEPLPEPTTRTGGRSHERQAFDRSIAQLAAGLSAGTVKLDDSDRNPFAPRRGPDA